MKILAVSHSALIESYQEKYDFLANKFGHEVLLLTQKKREEGGGRQVEAQDRQNGNLFVKTLPSLFTKSLRRHFYLGLTGYARGFQPDLIYAENEPQAASTYQALKAANKFKAKFVFFTWENIKQSYSGRKRKIEKKVLKKSTGAIAGNREGQQILKELGFKEDIAVIPQYGINPDVFYPQDGKGLREKLSLQGRFIIGYVGRLLPEKNIASLIQALANLPETCVLIIIGSGSEEETLQRQVEKLELSDRVNFIPAVSYEDIPKYMNLFDTLVLPSITTNSWKEQFGRVLPEAMACQTPVIGSDSGEIPNVIGKAGLVFPEGNVQKLTTAIKKLLTDKSFYNLIAAQGAKRALQLYTNEAIAGQMNDFFLKLLSNENKGRN